MFVMNCWQTEQTHLRFHLLNAGGAVGCRHQMRMGEAREQMTLQMASNRGRLPPQKQQQHRLTSQKIQ